MDTDSFDIKAGMDVYGTDGQKIGEVTEVAGFGRPQAGDPADGTGNGRPSGAGSGTGYLRVKRTAAEGAVPPADLYIRFRDVQEVTPERGVVVLEPSKPQPTAESVTDS